MMWVQQAMWVLFSHTGRESEFRPQDGTPCLLEGVLASTMLLEMNTHLLRNSSSKQPHLVMEC